jgi:hypothetical protein
LFVGFFFAGQGGIMSEDKKKKWLNTFIQPENRLTDKQYAAVGRVAVTWSLMEYLMERTLGRLAMSPSLIGYVVTDRLGPDNRISAIKSLINVHRVRYGSELVPESVLAGIEALLTTLFQMKADRNFVVHSVWSKSGEDHLSRIDIAGAARSGLSTSSGSGHGLRELEVFSGEIQKLCDKLFDLSSKIPRIDPALLAKLQKLEEPGHQPQSARSARLVQPRSYTMAEPPHSPPKKQRTRT